jgi:beta-lactamase regulating signal transducer with metallopeptidase domain
MNALLQIGLSNAVVCGVMTAFLLPLASLLRKPALTHAFGVLILIKLVTPPVFNVTLPRIVSPGSTPSRQFALAGAMPVEGSSTTTASVITDAAAAEDDEQTSAPAQPTWVPEPAPSLTRASSPTAEPARISAAAARIWQSASDHWRSWLAACWIASALLLAALALLRIIRLAFAIRQATVWRPDITADLAPLAKQLGLGRLPRVRFIAGSAPPMVVALWPGSPLLVIPTGLWDRLERRQQRMLLLHELAHLRRGDHRVRYLELMATCIYWWHPALWLVRGILREAEEQCCDAWVIWAMPDGCRAYMTTLVDAIDFLSQRTRPRFAATPVIASGMGQFHNLQRRLTMVRDQNVQRRLGGGGLTAMALLAALALPLGTNFARGQNRAGAQPAGSALSAVTPDLPEAGVTSEAPASSSSSGSNQAAPTASRIPSDQDQEIARLEADLDAAQRNVEHFRSQLDALRRRSQSNRAADAISSTGPGPNPGQQTAPVNVATATPSAQNPMTSAAGATRAPKPRRASLGYIDFVYHETGGGFTGTILAYDGDRLMWKLDVPLNADSTIGCYDNDNLIIKSADGYTRIVTAENGQLIQAWAPRAADAPAAKKRSVNPFGLSSAVTDSGAKPSAAHATRVATAAAASGLPTGSDTDKRLDRIEEQVRQLTEAVNRLTREQEQKQNPPVPLGR